jgi:phage regulator Rha-like protein
MPNFELQLVERLAGMEKLLKTQPSPPAPSQPAHNLGEQSIAVFFFVFLVCMP